MRRVVDSLALGIVPPAILLERPFLQTIPAEAQPAGGSKVRQEAAEQRSVPAVRLEKRRGRHRAQHAPGVVIAVVDAGRVRQTPAEESKRRALRTPPRPSGKRRLEV